MPGEVIRIGFVPLVDCALLAIAQERGFFARQHVDVELRKLQSWGQIREKMQERELDAAHMLITMPLQAALESSGGSPPFNYAYTLSRNGNGIILSNALWNVGVRDGIGLAAWMAAHPKRALRLGVVYPRGTQEYFLRSWLACGEITIDERILLSIIPPQEMVGRLRKGEIDGFAVGEPWSRRAAASKLGRLVAESGKSLPGIGEKVLAVRPDWHRANSLEHTRILRALNDASVWMEDEAHFGAAVDIISSKRYVNTSKSAVGDALRAGSPQPGAPRESARVRHQPARAHAEWYLRQMSKWGHADARAVIRLEFSSICLESFYQSTFPPAHREPLPVRGRAAGSESEPLPAGPPPEVPGRPAFTI